MSFWQKAHCGADFVSAKHMAFVTLVSQAMHVSARKGVELVFAAVQQSCPAGCSIGGWRRDGLSRWPSNSWQIRVFGPFEGW